MRKHACPDWDLMEIGPGDPEMQGCTCDPVDPGRARLAKNPCPQPCTLCPDARHHWLPDCDEDNGMPLLQCKHCEAQREYADEDELADEALGQQDTGGADHE